MSTISVPVLFHVWINYYSFLNYELTLTQLITLSNNFSCKCVQQKHNQYIINEHSFNLYKTSIKSTGVENNWNKKWQIRLQLLIKMSFNTL